MSEKESDKGSLYKHKLRVKPKGAKDPKKPQKTDKDKAYETDEQVSLAGSVHAPDRAYESDTLGGPNLGYVPPPLIPGAGPQPMLPLPRDNPLAASAPPLTEEGLEQMLAAGLFNTDEPVAPKEKDVTSTKTAPTENQNKGAQGDVEAPAPPQAQVDTQPNRDAAKRDVEPVNQHG